MGRERMAAQDIFQLCCSVRNRQLNPPTDLDLEAQVAEQLHLWGGVGLVDDFLKKSDPGHSLLSQIVGIDWTFLDRKK